VSTLGRNLRAIAHRNEAAAAALETACAMDAACGGSRVPADDIIEVVRAASGALTLRVGGRLEASEIDPERDGEAHAREFLEQARAAGARRIVLFGLGLYTLPHLAAAAAEGWGILVIEPSAALARTVLSHVDLARALAHIDLMVGDDVAQIVQHATFRGEERGVFVCHAAARHRARKLHAALAARFTPGGPRGPLDIAVIPPLYGGSLPVAHAAGRALRALGHRVRAIDLAAFEPAYRHLVTTMSDLRLRHLGEQLRAGLSRIIGEAVYVQLMLDPPDIVLALAQAPVDGETLARFRSRGVVCAFWFCEDAHVMRYWEQLCTAYDVFFHLQPDVLCSALDGRGVYNAPLPMAFDPEMHKSVSLTPEERQRYGADLSFVGAAYHNRVEWLPGVADLGLRIYGTGWPTSPPFAKLCAEPNVRQSTASTNLIFNATRINLNLHSSPWTDGVNPAGDYLNPRVYEIAGAGTFQLVDERSHLAAAFDAGRELETYRDLRECRVKIRHYLAHPDEAAEIAEHGRARAMAEHTYQHRMDLACEILRAGPRPIAVQRSARRTVRAAREAVETAEPTLACILARVSDDQVLDGDAITAAVAQGHGELCEEEKLLLFMREAMSEIQVLNAGGDPA
jgi:spore maturation protein CgeB